MVVVFQHPSTTTHFYSYSNLGRGEISGFRPNSEIRALRQPFTLFNYYNYLMEV